MVTCCVEKFKMSKMVDFIADLYTTLEKLVIANFRGMAFICVSRPLAISWS